MPHPFTFEFEFFILTEEEDLVAIELTERHIPELDGHSHLVLGQLPVRLAVLGGIHIWEWYLEGLLYRTKRRQTRLPQQAALFIRTTAHLLSPAQTAWERHIYLLFLVYLFSIVGFGGHFQDHSIRSRSPIRNDVPSLVQKLHVDNTHGHHAFLLVLSPEQCPAIHLCLDGHLSHGLAAIGLHVMTQT